MEADGRDLQRGRVRHALKPAFLRHLLHRDVDHFTKHAICYLDPDIVVYRPFPEIFGLADSAGIALTPHVLHPLPQMGATRMNEC